MIGRDLARELVALINNLPAMELLEEYINSRIAWHQKHANQSNDFNEILRSQGAIKELERFRTLRDEVIADAEYKE